MEGANLEEAECPLVKRQSIIRWKIRTEDLPGTLQLQFKSSECWEPPPLHLSHTALLIPLARSSQRSNNHRCYEDQLLQVSNTHEALLWVDMFLSNLFIDGVKCSYHRTCIEWGEQEEWELIFASPSHKVLHQMSFRKAFWFATWY